MGYLASAVIVVLSKFCAGFITKILMFLPSICTEELLSVTKIITFSPLLPSVHENYER